MLSHVGPCCSKLAPSWHKVAQVGPSWFQVNPKLAPTWPHVGPCWAKLAPSWPQVGSKLAPSWPMLAQVGPNWCKLAPNWPQDAPKWAYVGLCWPQIGTPRGPQRLPKASQMAPHGAPKALQRRLQRLPGLPWREKCNFAKIVLNWLLHFGTSS